MSPLSGTQRASLLPRRRVPLAASRARKERSPVFEIELGESKPHLASPNRTMASVDAIAFGSLIALGEYVLTQRASAKDDTAAAAAAESAASGASQPKQSGSILKLFRIPGLSKAGEIELIAKFNSKLEDIGSLSRVSKVSTESSLYIQFEDGASFESIGADGERNNLAALHFLFECYYESCLRSQTRLLNSNSHAAWCLLDVPTRRRTKPAQMAPQRSIAS